MEIDFKRLKMRRIHPERRVDKCSERLFIQTYLQIQMLSDQKKEQTPNTTWAISVYLLIFLTLSYSNGFRLSQAFSLVKEKKIKETIFTRSLSITSAVAALSLTGVSSSALLFIFPTSCRENVSYFGPKSSEQ